MSESRNGSFYEGKTPSLINVHEAYISGKIAKEEGQDLNSKYDPDKVVGVYKKPNKSGTTYNRTQGQVLDSMVAQRKSKTGNYKYKAQKKDE